ncbi:hypothetical protein AGLY_005879 [Aphis glycines]|uniref:Uncharacterized protein n=1 Tax=Aphis glycines TaxID=307491 RepID=A0A6G0TSM2_APHGL|nr:hypothetical protein AGLY_005879 [Aphis glycines]
MKIHYNEFTNNEFRTKYRFPKTECLHIVHKICDFFPRAVNNRGKPVSANSRQVIIDYVYRRHGDLYGVVNTKLIDSTSIFKKEWLTKLMKNLVINFQFLANYTNIFINYTYKIILIFLILMILTNLYQYFNFKRLEQLIKTLYYIFKYFEIVFLSTHFFHYRKKTEKSKISVIILITYKNLVNVSSDYSDQFLSYNDFFENCLKILIFDPLQWTKYIHFAIGNHPKSLKLKHYFDKLCCTQILKNNLHHYWQQLIITILNLVNCNLSIQKGISLFKTM